MVENVWCFFFKSDSPTGFLHDSGLFSLLGPFSLIADEHMCVRSISDDDNSSLRHF